MPGINIEVMKRVLGLDYGLKRIGVAVSDPLGITAQPVTTIIVKSFDQIIQDLKVIREEYEYDRIVVGLPVNMNGTEGDFALQTREFAKTLETNLDVEIVFSDERLSSRLVDRAMIEGGTRRAKRRTRKDVLAAVVILQGYLDSAG